ncbi:MAG: D-alanine--D-alanine ligase [Parasporobacterium sp.]|nr:D-alanine--D-alanine ligase [Parasporobacterium sp.]
MGPCVLDTCRKADIVFIGLHGENGEDGKIQAVFDQEGIRYTGSDSESSAIAMSKDLTKKAVSQYIRMPEGVTAVKNADNQRIPVPCVIKPSNGGSSVGVVRVKDDAEYDNALKEAFMYDDVVLVEEFVEGRELTQAVLDGKALPPVEIIPDKDEWYDYSNKYNGLTKEVCPAEIPGEVLAEMSEKSVRFGEILGLSVYYRIDYILDKEGKLYALEANSLPGMTDTSLVPQEAAAAGIGYPELCEKIIEISMKKYGK